MRQLWTRKTEALEVLIACGPQLDSCGKIQMLMPSTTPAPSDMAAAVANRQATSRLGTTTDMLRKAMATST
ncbi:hypothetical protein D3C73_1653400 [compost metagenome]